MSSNKGLVKIHLKVLKMLSFKNVKLKLSLKVGCICYNACKCQNGSQCTLN